jgi:hypothetical protein
VILDDSDDQGRRKALRRAFVLHENSFYVYSLWQPF